MKRIEAIVRPEKLDAVRIALEKAGCKGIMISEIEGHGAQKGIVQQWRGEKYRVELLPKIKIDIVTKDDQVERIVKTIIDVSRTGEIGDGKIFVSPVENVFRIRTGENGESAI
ncbi:MAG: P-II family nitrogen regulator [Candidatus Omnitrophota bacterium]|nr:P-II family nitrogen regulator [Candidatus Omnitrophota bacterium]